MTEIKLLKQVDFSGYTFIEGFPGAGLVGPMAISYIISKLSLDYVGYVDSELLPPLVSIHDDMPLPPVRLYHSKKYKIVALFAETIPNKEAAIYHIADTLNEFIKKGNFSLTISISGVPVEKPNGEDVYGIVSTPKLSKVLDGAGIKKIGEGVATGIGACLIMKAAIDNRDDISLLVQVNPEMIDPKYAELAIKKVNKILGIDIDVSELDKEAKEVEARIRDLLQKSKQTPQGIDTPPPVGPSMYA
ncbi:protein containing DUF75 [mine drainage metagenome]|uniref:Protein containing DUF75 n=1 Tax=mine drainage metagenome TaxID=410659 RepID=T0ZM57_9ZZZZ